MDADNHGFKYGNETRELFGCAMDLLNGLGYGLLEKPCENALAVEFKLRGISCLQQACYDVLSKEVVVGEYIPDLIAFEKVVVDTLGVDRITDHEIEQRLNYLKITGLKVGLIINFRRAALKWKRMAL